MREVHLRLLAALSLSAQPACCYHAGMAPAFPRRSPAASFSRIARVSAAAAGDASADAIIGESDSIAAAAGEDATLLEKAADSADAIYRFSRPRMLRCAQTPPGQRCCVSSKKG